MSDEWFECNSRGDIMVSVSVRSVQYGQWSGVKRPGRDEVGPGMGRGWVGELP